MDRTQRSVLRLENLHQEQCRRVHITLTASRPVKSAIFYAEMSERFKEPVLKTGDTERYRGFESHSPRHIKEGSSVYVIKLPSGVYLVEGVRSWSPTMFSYEATSYESKRKAYISGKKFLGNLAFFMERL